MLVDHLSDLRVLARIPAPDRPRILRAAVALDLVALTWGEDAEDEDGGRLLPRLLGDLSVELDDAFASELAHDLARLDLGDVVIEAGSPELRLEAGVADVADRLVAALR